MITKNDIEVLKEVFVTKAEFNKQIDRLRNELDKKIDNLETLITQGFKEVIELYSESLRKSDDYSTTVKMHIQVVRDHEKRISILEEKCD